MKKRFAKLTALALAGVMVLGMTACGANTDPATSTDNNDTSAKTESKSSDISVGIVVKPLPTRIFRISHMAPCWQEKTLALP